METRCIRVKLKANSIDKVKVWFNELNARKVEVLETLKNEGIIIESAFLDNIKGEDYLIYYIKSNNIQSALEIFKKSILPIDDFYKANWTKFCEESVILDPLLDMDLLQ